MFVGKKPEIQNPSMDFIFLDFKQNSYLFQVPLARHTGNAMTYILYTADTSEQNDWLCAIWFKENTRFIPLA